MMGLFDEPALLQPLQDMRTAQTVLNLKQKNKILELAQLLDQCDDDALYRISLIQLDEQHTFHQLFIDDALIAYWKKRYHGSLKLPQDAPYTGNIPIFSAYIAHHLIFQSQAYRKQNEITRANDLLEQA